MTVSMDLISFYLYFTPKKEQRLRVDNNRIQMKHVELREMKHEQSEEKITKIMKMTIFLGIMRCILVGTDVSEVITACITS
jgi:hypothetical protein